MHVPVILEDVNAVTDRRVDNSDDDQHDTGSRKNDEKRRWRSHLLKA